MIAFFIRFEWAVVGLKGPYSFKYTSLSCYGQLSGLVKAWLNQDLFSIGIESPWRQEGSKPSDALQEKQE